MKYNVATRSCLADIATVQDGLVHASWAQRIPMGCRDLATHLGRLLQSSGATPSAPLTRQQLSAMLAAAAEVVEQHEARTLTASANGAGQEAAVGRYTLPDGTVLSITDQGKRLGEALVQVWFLSVCWLITFCMMDDLLFLFYLFCNHMMKSACVYIFCRHVSPTMTSVDRPSGTPQGLLATSICTLFTMCTPQCSLPGIDSTPLASRVIESQQWQMDMLTRRAWLESVLVCGGGSGIPGLSQRLVQVRCSTPFIPPQKIKYNKKPPT